MATTVQTAATSRSISGFCAEAFNRDASFPVKATFWRRNTLAPHKGREVNTNTYLTLSSFKEHLSNGKGARAYWVPDFVIEVTDAEGIRIYEDEWQNLL